MPPRGEGAFGKEGGKSPGKQSERLLSRSSPVEVDRPRPSRRGSLAEMLHLGKKTSSTGKLPESDYSKPKKSKTTARNMPAKSPKIFRLRSRSVKKRHQSTPVQESDMIAEPLARRVSAQPTLFDSDQGFIITPPDSFSGRNRVAEMVSRMKGYHSVSADLESLPGIVISTMVTLSVHPTFPTSLYLYMLARNEGNLRATCEDLINLGWGTHEKEGEGRAQISRTITSRKDEHFTTPYYHGNIRLELLVKKIRQQKAGSYLTYAVVQDHTFQYYCLFISDNPIYTSQRDLGHGSSLSPPKSLSPLRKTRMRKTRSPLASPVASPAASPESSPRSDADGEMGVLVCAAIDTPTVSDDFLVKNDCCFPLMRRQQPSTRFVPFLHEHASQTCSPRTDMDDSAEDPNYTLELLGVLTAALPLEQRIFKYNTKLEELKEQLESLEPTDARRLPLSNCCDGFKAKIQQLKLSLYGQEEEEAASSGNTCGFLSFSDMSLPAVTPSTSLVPDAAPSNVALRESESLSVGFLWAVDDA